MKDKLTQQSISLFDEKGFSETSIQDIVDALGVTKGTFYYYFSSKEELLMDIQLAYIDDILSHQERILLDSTKNCKDKLFEIVYLLIRNIERQGASAKVFFREMRHLNEERLNEIIPKRDQFRKNVETLINQGMGNGEFRTDLNARIVTFGLLGMTNWSYQWFNPSSQLTDKELSEIYLEMVLNGISK
ncbi:TetR/AcrR family transcriptional regulator [Bacillus spongiae]|uniref:TetR/AcrR family transcriptional regulator n=1 Tax=Bacillus spongiae TaxID=2683610 RepID=A0ABU8HCI8_9BACI